MPRPTFSRLFSTPLGASPASGQTLAACRSLIAILDFACKDPTEQSVAEARARLSAVSMRVRESVNITMQISGAVIPHWLDVRFKNRDFSQRYQTSYIDHLVLFCTYRIID